MFSDPVIGKDFFDREPILNLLAKRVEGLKGGYRQNIGIIGQELLGKTSLIQQFLVNFKESQIIPIYIELKIELFTHFSQRFIGSLLYYFLKSEKEPQKDSLSYLIQESIQYLPRTIESIKKIEVCLEKRQHDRAYLLLLGLTTLLEQETGKKIIIILDEFHRLAGFKLTNPFLNFGKKIMVQKNTMYIVTSSSVNVAKNILREKLSLLFGNFEIVELEPFDFKNSRKFLDEKFKWVNIPGIYKNFLIILTAGHPFYLDVISLKLRKIIVEKKLGKVPLELISQALESEIFNSRGILNQYLTNRINKFLEGRGTTTYISILLAIANNRSKLSEIAKSMRKKSADLSKQIMKLIEMDFIRKCGVFYKLNDPILSFWLKSVYQRRQMGLISEVFSKSEDFREDVREMALRLVNESKRDLFERVKDLFRSFKNETIELGQRKFKLPQFIEVESRIVQNQDLSIVARQKDRYWVGQIEKEKVGENRIIEFIQKCKKAEYKIQRKFLIILKEIDINAKLLAKEEKIWIWDINDLNLLLELYNKPQVVQ